MTLGAAFAEAFSAFAAWEGGVNVSASCVFKLMGMVPGDWVKVWMGGGWIRGRKTRGGRLGMVCAMRYA